MGTLKSSSALFTFLKICMASYSLARSKESYELPGRSLMGINAEQTPKTKQTETELNLMRVSFIAFFHGATCAGAWAWIPPTTS